MSTSYLHNYLGGDIGGAEGYNRRAKEEEGSQSLLFEWFVKMSHQP